jgi:division protein 1
MGPSGDTTTNTHYHNAMVDIHRELRRPDTQRRVFALTQTTPTDLVRSKLSTSEIQSRALSSLPDELLANIPEDSSTYSLFQGFQATQDDQEYRKTHRRGRSKSKKLLKEKGASAEQALPSTSSDLKKERDLLNRRMELMGVRKNMCSSEILDIDNKIANFHRMRQIVLDRLAGLEMEEAELEHEGGYLVVIL